jgi:hypothetical protein
MGAPHVWPAPHELTLSPPPDVAWDASVEQLLACTDSMLKAYVTGLHREGRLRQTARVITRGGRFFGVVYLIGSDSWLILPLNTQPGLVTMTLKEALDGSANR